MCSQVGTPLSAPFLLRSFLNEYHWTFSAGHVRRRGGIAQRRFLRFPGGMKNMAVAIPTSPLPAEITHLAHHRGSERQDAAACRGCREPLSLPEIWAVSSRDDGPIAAPVLVRVSVVAWRKENPALTPMRKVAAARFADRIERAVAWA